MTYELSAAAQRLLGNNLRSEALLTVGGLALGAAVTLVATLALAPWPWALFTGVMAILISPKLYGYPKVLVLALATALIVRYCSRPSRAALVAMAVLTAVAFLFRHDYAVYCGVGCAAAITSGSGANWTTTGRRLLAYGALSLAFVTPSLLWVERQVGLLRYLGNGLQIGATERARTAIALPTFDMAQGLSPMAFFAQETNAEAWLFYLFWGIPLIVLLLAAVRRQHGVAHTDTSAHVCLAVMTLALLPIFLRGSLEGRFVDMVPPVAALAAVLLAVATKRPIGLRVPTYVLRSVAALVVAAATVMAIWSLGAVGREMQTTRIAESPSAVVRRASGISARLAALPDAIWTEPTDRVDLQMAAYLHECTTTADRVLVASYVPEVLAFADRRFAGGSCHGHPLFYAGDSYDAYTLGRLDAAPPSIVLAADNIPRWFPRLDQYLKQHYDLRGSAELSGGRILQILALKGLAARPYGDQAWPCFA